MYKSGGFVSLTPDEMRHAIAGIIIGLGMAPGLLVAAEWRARTDSGYTGESGGGGRFDLRVRVNGETTCEIRGLMVSCFSRDGMEPRDAGCEATRPIPEGRMVGLRTDQRDGRSRMTVVEEPSRRNNFALVVRIDDRRKGDDGRHHLRITWEDERGGGGGYRPSGGFGDTRGGDFGGNRGGDFGGGGSGSYTWDRDIRYRGEGRGDYFRSGSREPLRDAYVDIDRRGNARVSFDSRDSRPLTFTGRVRRAESDRIVVDIGSGETMRIQLDGDQVRSIRIGGDADERLRWDRY